MKTTRRIACGAAALFVLAAPVAAQPTSNGNGVAAGGVAILSGGVGDASVAEMKQAAKDYNVRLVFSNRRGEYVADVPYTITDARRREVAAGTSDGPLLYLRLPPGRYEVSARIGTTAVKKRIQALSKGSGPEISLVGDES